MKIMLKKGNIPHISDANNFDFLRLLFAFSVLISHFGVLTQNKLYFPISSAMAVAGFFIISGFLITRSFYNSTSIASYFSKRAKRILPAYMAVVLLCAVGLSFISQLSVGQYFSSPDFFKYTGANLTFLNFLQPTLPGVFADNHLPFVDGSLWTIKVEIALYLCVPILFFFIRRTKPYLVCISVYIISVLFALWMDMLYEQTGKAIYPILSRQFLGQFKFFVAGGLLFFYFEFLMKNLKYLFPIASIIVVSSRFFNLFPIQFFYPISFAIVIIGFAYHCKFLNNVGKQGDISYGMYLFHFPIIQTFVSFGFLKQNPVLLFFVILITVSVVSFASWHLLEKRFLKRKR